VFRILLLSLLVWLIGLTQAVLTVKGWPFLARYHPDRRRAVLIGKATRRFTQRWEAREEESDAAPKTSAFFW